MDADGANGTGGMYRSVHPGGSGLAKLVECLVVDGHVPCSRCMFMRRLIPLAVFLAWACPAIAHADAHADMAAALEAQIEAHPAPAIAPVTVPMAPATTKTAVKPSTSRIPVDATARAVTRIQQAVIGLSTALARQTQASAQTAAGQAQAKAARERASRNPR